MFKRRDNYLDFKIKEKRYFNNSYILYRLIMISSYSVNFHAPILLYNII